MKLYKHQPSYLIQLTFRRGKERVIYLTLCDATIDLTYAMLSFLFPSGNRKDKTCLKTRIEIRERIGGKNGKYKAYSFYGGNAIRTRRKIYEYLENLANAPVS